MNEMNPQKTLVISFIMLLIVAIVFYKLPARQSSREHQDIAHQVSPDVESPIEECLKHWLRNMTGQPDQANRYQKIKREFRQLTNNFTKQAINYIVRSDQNIDESQLKSCQKWPEGGPEFESAAEQCLQQLLGNMEAARRFCKLINELLRKDINYMLRDDENNVPSPVEVHKEAQKSGRRVDSAVERCLKQTLGDMEAASSYCSLKGGNVDFTKTIIECMWQDVKISSSAQKLSKNNFFVIFIVLLLIVTSLIPVAFLSKMKLRNSSQMSVEKGNRFKVLQQWLEAGREFESAAEQFSRQSRGEMDAANNFSEAANCYRKLKEVEFTKKAAELMQRAAQIYAEQGQFSIAARHLEEAGDLLRSVRGGDQAELSAAIGLYLRAADFWDGENSPASAGGCRTKAAELMADCGRLADAAEQFEQLGVSSQSHSLLGFGAKDHLFKSCLCLLCSGSAELAGEKAQQLASMSSSFADSDELSLVTRLTSAARAGDVGSFDAAVSEFEKFNNLDDFAQRRLQQLRTSVAGDAEPLR